jgi:hypothetical protein
MLNAWVSDVTNHYKTNQIFLTMGEDFYYANAKQNFNSLDKLIEYFNNKFSNVTLMYSTPTIYLNALRAMNIKWPTKYDDMFPYADDVKGYWTGYFTSRPNAKDYFRTAARNMHSSNKLYSL